jgi:DNA-binding FadR family transcriptional regulator
LIESSVAEELAHQANSDALEDLRKQAEVDGERANDLSACMAGEGFHRAILKASGNKTLMLYQSLITPIVDQHIGRFLAGGADSRSAAEAANPRISHPTLLRLVESGDAGLARDFWHEHLARLESVLTEARFTTVTDLASG